MTLSQKIEKTFFINRSKTELIEETRNNMLKLLDEIFTTDENEIRSDFPKNTQRQDISVDNLNVAIYLESHLYGEPVVEIIFQLIYNELPIGRYSNFYDCNGKYIDEWFIIDYSGLNFK